MKAIEIKPNNNNYYTLLINGKPTSVPYSYHREAAFLTSGDPEVDLLPKLLPLNCVDFPDNLEVWTHFSPTADMPLVDNYTINRSGNKLTIQIAVFFNDKAIMQTKWNCVVFLDQLVKATVRKGWVKSKYWKKTHTADDKFVMLHYPTTVEKTFEEKINEALKELKNCLAETELIMQTLTYS